MNKKIARMMIIGIILVAFGISNSPFQFIIIFLGLLLILGAKIIENNLD